MNQVYYTVTINGAEVESVENTEPKTVTNVRVFAGDKFKPAADASYRNLVWETFHIDHRLNVGTKVERNTQIGTIDTLGPFFRVNFDLMIHSHSVHRWIFFTHKFLIPLHQTSMAKDKTKEEGEGGES